MFIAVIFAIVSGRVYFKSRTFELFRYLKQIARYTSKV